MTFLRLTPSRSLVVVLALAPCANAYQAQGATSSFAAGLSLAPEGSSGPTAPEALYIKAPGAQSSPLAAWQSSRFTNIALPIYTSNAIFGTALAAVVEVDGQSTGNDLIPPLDANGVTDLQATQNWMAIVVSLAAGSTGQPGSVPSYFSSNGAIQSHLFGHYMEHSVGLSQLIPGRTYLEQRPEDMGLATMPERDVDGLDYAIGVQSHAQSIDPQVVFNSRRWYYFTLSPACIAGVGTLVGDNFAIDPGNGRVGADPASIYRTEWNSSTLAWGPIVRVRAAQALNLDPEVDNVDALAVSTGVDPLIVFSTQVVPGRSQLLVSQPNTTPVPFLGRMPSGTPTYSVAQALTGSDDIEDIDAVCIADPENGDLANLAGTPSHELSNSFLAPGDPLSLSVTRSFPPGQAEQLHLLVSGWASGAPSNEWMGVYMLPSESSDIFAYTPVWTGVLRTSTEIVKQIDIPYQPGFRAPALSIVVLSVDLNTSVPRASWVCRMDGQ